MNELHQQLDLLKQHNDQLETEKYVLTQQLENQSFMNSNQERNTSTPGEMTTKEIRHISTDLSIDSVSSDSKPGKKQIHPAPIHEVSILSLDFCMRFW